MRSKLLVVFSMIGLVAHALEAYPYPFYAIVWLGGTFLFWASELNQDSTL